MCKIVNNLFESVKKVNYSKFLGFKQNQNLVSYIIKIALAINPVITYVSR